VTVGGGAGGGIGRSWAPDRFFGLTLRTGRLRMAGGEGADSVLDRAIFLGEADADPTSLADLHVTRRINESSHHITSLIASHLISFHLN